MAATPPGRAPVKLTIMVGVMALLVLLPASGASATSGSGPQTGTNGLVAELTAPDVVRLSWQPVEGASGYEIDVAIDGLGTAAVASVSIDETDWEDLRAPAATDLHYTVRAVGSDGTYPAADVTITTGARQPDPMPVTVDADAAAATALAVGPEGGELVAVDANGVTYVLQVPPGALDEVTELTMTPASTSDDWPLDERPLGLVALEPAGLVLAEPATLTITAPAASGNLAVLGFSLSGAAGELGLVRPGPLAPPDVASLVPVDTAGGAPFAQPGETVIVLPVTIMEPAGALTIAGDKAASLGRTRVPSNAAAATEHKAAAQSATDTGMAGGSGTAGAGSYLYDGMALARATDRLPTCGAVNSQIGSWQVWRRKSSFVAVTPDAFDPVDKAIRDALARETTSMLEFIAENCDFEGVTPADLTCAESLLKRLGAMGGRPSGDFADLAATIGEATLGELRQALEECRTISYVVQDTPGVRTWSGPCFDSLTQSKIVLKWKGTAESGVFTLRPDSEGSGTITEVLNGKGPGYSFKFQGKGRYEVKVIESRPDGTPSVLDIVYSTKGKARQCVPGGCINTKIDGDEAMIPLKTQRGSCAR